MERERTSLPAGSKRRLLVSDEKKSSANNYVTFRLIPFTGMVFTIWAFFSPEGYGHWLGVIVRSFRISAGF